MSTTQYTLDFLRNYKSWDRKNFPVSKLNTAKKAELQNKINDFVEFFKTAKWEIASSSDYSDLVNWDEIIKEETTRYSQQEGLIQGLIALCNDYVGGQGAAAFYPTYRRELKIDRNIVLSGDNGFNQVRIVPATISITLILK